MSIVNFDGSKAFDSNDPEDGRKTPSIPTAMLCLLGKQQLNHPIFTRRVRSRRESVRDFCQLLCELVSDPNRHPELAAFLVATFDAKAGKFRPHRMKKYLEMHYGIEISDPTLKVVLMELANLGRDDDENNYAVNIGPAPKTPGGGTGMNLGTDFGGPLNGSSGPGAPELGGNCGGSAPTTSARRVIGALMTLVGSTLQEPREKIVRVPGMASSFATSVVASTHASARPWILSALIRMIAGVTRPNPVCNIEPIVSANLVMDVVLAMSNLYTNSSGSQDERRAREPNEHITKELELILKPFADFIERERNADATGTTNRVQEEDVTREHRSLSDVVRALFGNVEDSESEEGGDLSNDALEGILALLQEPPRGPEKVRHDLAAPTAITPIRAIPVVGALDSRYVPALAQLEALAAGASKLLTFPAQ